MLIRTSDKVDKMSHPYEEYWKPTREWLEDQVLDGTGYGGLRQPWECG